MNTVFATHSPRSATAGRPINPRGFSLVELLAVMTVICLTFGLAMPAFHNIAGGGHMPNVATEVGSVLEFARNEGMTRQTYAWVMFKNGVNADGNRELRAVVLASDDGTAKGAKFQVSRVFKLSNVILTDFAALQAKTRELVPEPLAAGTASVGANEPASSVKVGDTEYDRVVTFSPRGEVLLESDPRWDTGFSRTVDISLRTTRGNNDPLPNAADAVIMIGGSSGKIETIYSR